MPIEYVRLSSEKVRRGVKQIITKIRTVVSPVDCNFFNDIMQTYTFQSGLAQKTINQLTN